MRWLIPWLLCLGTAGGLTRPTLGLTQHPADTHPRYPARLVWVMTNLMVNEQADRLVRLIDRAARAGFTGLVLSDHKFNFLERMPVRYFRNAGRVLDRARARGLEIIPALFPIGYSNGLLANDPNLAEGLPVIDAAYEVRRGQAVLAADRAVQFRNADLEETRGDLFTGFGFQDNPGKTSFVDRREKHHGQASCRMENLASSPVCRLIQTVRTHPHACYRLSCWVKTRDLENAGDFHLMAIGGSGRQLSFQEGVVQPTQDWTQVELVFNSLEETSVNLYAGIWEGKSGVLWIDDFSFTELSFVNLLRRGGCPLQVRSADRQTVYREGTDFEKLVDPQLGMTPYAGEFAFNHKGPVLRLTPRSQIREGQRLLVSWYHPLIVHAGQVACCLTEPKVYELLRDQAERVNRLFHPRAFFMQHDELRVANWCASCVERKAAPGQLLADNVRQCRRILQKVNPRAEVLVWSDMFDPHHNAVAQYYLVQGPLTNSWQGLDPGVIIANWNSGKAGESLAFFERRGHRQLIAGYYDGDDNFASWNRAAKGVTRIYGFMYTTWQNRYDDLEKYGKLLQTSQ